MLLLFRLPDDTTKNLDERNMYFFFMIGNCTPCAKTPMTTDGIITAVLPEICAGDRHPRDRGLAGVILYFFQTASFCIVGIRSIDQKTGLARHAARKIEDCVYNS